MTDHATFVARLRQLMAARNLATQKDLAQAVGVAPPTVWAWFHQGVPQARTMETICRNLRITHVWLEDGVGPMDAPETQEPRVHEEPAPFKVFISHAEEKTAEKLIATIRRNLDELSAPGSKMSAHGKWMAAWLIEGTANELKEIYKAEKDSEHRKGKRT